MSDAEPKTETREGWAWPTNSRKAHYIVNGMSLCRKLGYFGSKLEKGADDSPDNCAECKKRLKKRYPPAAAERADG